MDTGFTVPTLADLVTRISADYNTRLPGEDARIRRSFAWVLARVQAGAVWTLYQFASWIARQILVDTSDSAVVLRHAAIWGVVPVSGTAAAGNISCTGTNGSVIPAGTLLQRADGVVYQTTAEATISGTTTVPVEATEIGEDGESESGVALTFVSPISGVSSSAVVASGGLTGGTDDETIESLRARILLRIRNPPQGGCAADYELWAREALATVDRVFVVPWEEGEGHVSVYFTVEGTGAGVIPDAGDLSTVAAYLATKAPVTAHVDVKAPTEHELNPTLSISPDTEALRDAVEAQLEAYCQQRDELAGDVYLSQISDAVGQVAGLTWHDMTAPAADFVLSAGEILTLGTVTWA